MTSSTPGAGTAPPRILRVITRLNIGGPARQALSLSRLLRPEYDTMLAAGTPAKDEGELTDPAVRVTRVPLVRPLRPLSDVSASVAIRSLLKNFAPALVHTHMAKAGTLARSTALSVRERPVLVHTFHGHVLDGYFSDPVRNAFLAAERFLGSQTDALIAVSEEIRDELLDLGIGRRNRWHVIPLGFDLSGFLRSVPGTGPLKGELGLAEGTSLVGIVGRLVPIKDHRTALEAFRQLAENVHLAIVGDGEERIAIEGLVHSMGLGARVHFLGWRMDVEAVMSSLDVVLLSSRNEGSPVALIEALACGVPVVATDVGGVRSVVQDGKSGFLVPPGDFRALASAASKLLDDPENAHKMGEAGRAYVRLRFDQTRLVADIRSLYEDLLGR